MTQDDMEEIDYPEAEDEVEETLDDEDEGLDELDI